MEKQPCIYILASGINGTLYTGVTGNLPHRVFQHKNNLVDGFTKKYTVHTLVYYEQYIDMNAAITRERQIKSGSRQAKKKLIQKNNPMWRDLYQDILE